MYMKGVAPAAGAERESIKETNLFSGCSACTSSGAGSTLEKAALLPFWGTRVLRGDGAVRLPRSDEFNDGVVVGEGYRGIEYPPWVKKKVDQFAGY